MKLIIDIPEEVYKDIMIHNRELRESGKSSYYLEGLIQNGIPHETVTEFADRCRECGREKVLDKIRDEIEALPVPYDNYDEAYVGYDVAKGEVIDLIDKYRKEQE